MAPDELRARGFDDRLHEVIETDLHDDRAASVVTDEVPTRVPGRLLLAVAELSPESVPAEATLEAAVAFECAALHQYLHAVPAAAADLVAPAADSPYAGDAVAAIVDGDFLQASAFARLSAAVRRERSAAGEGADEPADRPPAADAASCYRILSRASIRCYERRGEGDPADAAPLAPLVGAAGRIGALLGGVAHGRAATVGREARALGALVPVRTPTGVEGGARTDRSAIDRALRRVEDALAGTDGDGRLDGLLQVEAYTRS